MQGVEWVGKGRGGNGQIETGMERRVDWAQDGVGSVAVVHTES